VFHRFAALVIFLTFNASSGVDPKPPLTSVRNQALQSRDIHSHVFQLLAPVEAGESTQRREHWRFHRRRISLGASACWGALRLRN
jgi:hypothetical protein